MKGTVELPDGGGTIQLPPPGESQSLSLKHQGMRNRKAKIAFGLFLYGGKSPHVVPAGQGVFRLALS